MDGQQQSHRSRQVTWWLSRAFVPKPHPFFQASAAARQVRRDKASNLEAWLLDMCEIDDDEERMEVLDALVDPRYTILDFLPPNLARHRLRAAEV